MKFLGLANKLFKHINSNKSNSSGEVETSNAEINKSNFPMWLLIGGLGGLLFAISATFVVIISTLMFLGIIDVDINFGGGKTSCVNLPNINSVCKSITVVGQGTMSVDEYVAGVINAEVGGMSDENFNLYKAAAVAARSYALVGADKDGNGNCSVSNGQHFQAYKPNPDENMINAANETSGIVLVKDNKIYSSQYDALCIHDEDDENYYLCQGGTGEEHLVLPREWIVERQGQAYIDYIRNYVHGKGMSQNGAWYLAIERGWDYIKILNYFYGDDGATLATINADSSNSCSTSFNGNFEPLEEYNLWHANLNVLNRTLTTAEINSLNKYIDDSVDDAGYGTGAAVAAAGQSLTYWLEKQGYYLSYYWGGGHGYYGDANNTFVGVNPKWGSDEFGDDKDTGNVRKRPYFGMDCSAFTSWAIRTACKSNYGSKLAGSWYTMSGAKLISLDKAKPGDLLDSDGHVILVIKNNGDGSVITAESAGGNASGLVFSKYENAGNYNVVDMSSWYKDNCNSSR